MKQMKGFLAIFAAVFLIFTTNTSADEASEDWSFAKTTATTQVSEKADSLFAWAKAEYDEHEGEGLFKRFPQDGKAILATLELAKLLKEQSIQAVINGNTTKAQALLYAAEATAYYAVQMPHLLEKRLTLDAHASNQ